MNKKPNVVVKNENVSVAVWRNTNPSGVQYMTFVLSKFHQRGKEMITDSINFDRKELGKMIWVLDKMNDKVNAL